MPEDGTVKINSNAFDDYREEVARERYGMLGACMSVNILSVWLNNRGTMADLYGNFDPSKSMLVSLRVGDLRALTTRGAHDPVPQGIMASSTVDAPWHAVVWSRSGKRTRGMKAAMVELCTVFTGTT